LGDWASSNGVAPPSLRTRTVTTAGTDDGPRVSREAGLDGNEGVHRGRLEEEEGEEEEKEEEAEAVVIEVALVLAAVAVVLPAEPLTRHPSNAKKLNTAPPSSSKPVELAPLETEDPTKDMPPP
jgi:hypothetical protein